MSKRKLIIFDMDGTLVNSAFTIANAINYVREKLHLPKMDNKLIEQKVNDHTINPAKYFYHLESFSQEHERWFAEYYSLNHKKELVLYDGIYELLVELKASDFKLAVATNAYSSSTIESLTHLKILDLFDATVSHDEVKRGKPYPDMLFKLLKDLDISKDEAIFIGDGSRDEIASKRAGVDYIMVNWGFSEYTDAVKSIDILKSMLI